MVWFIVFLLLVMATELYVIFYLRQKAITAETQVESCSKEICRITDELIAMKSLYEELKAEFAASETSKIEDEIKEAKDEAAAIKKENEIRQVYLDEKRNLYEDTLN